MPHTPVAETGSVNVKEYFTQYTNNTQSSVNMCSQMIDSSYSETESHTADFGDVNPSNTVSMLRTVHETYSD